MRTTLIFTLSLLILTACVDRSNNQRIDHTDANQTDTLTMANIMEDTTKVLTANLPVYFDSTRVLIHTVGFMTETERKSRLESTYIKSKRDGYDSDNYNAMFDKTSNSISGNISNIMFEDIDNKTSKVLTTKALFINQIEYQRELWRKINKHYLFYSLYDKDNNRDKKIDVYDIRCLYISNLDGTEFKKISPNDQLYQRGEWVYWCLRYYFQTIEDSNKNGEFDIKDTKHFFYIDFSSDPYKVVEYNPLKDIV